MKKSQYEELKEDIGDIKDNHLPSIYKRLGEVEAKVWYILGFSAVLIPLGIVILAKVW